MNTPTYKTLLCLFLFVIVIWFCYLAGRYFSTMYENLDALSIDIKLWIKRVLPSINDAAIDQLTNGRSTMDSNFDLQKTNGFTQRGIFTDTDLAKVMKSGVLTDEEFTTICKNADLNDVELATMIAAKTKLVESYVVTIPPTKSMTNIGANTMVSGNVMTLTCNVGGNTMINGNALVQ